MKRSFHVFFAAFSAVLCAHAGVCELPGLKYDASVKSRATGFFRLERDPGGRWNFITPGGHGFFLAGNNGPSFMRGDFCPALGYAPYTRTLLSKYGKDRARWAKDVSSRLLSWNFNTISSWDTPAAGIVGNGLAFTRVIQLGKSFAVSVPNSDSNLIDNVGSKGRFPNVFHPDFERHCRRMADKVCARLRDNPWVIGWYTDNEVSWNGAMKRTPPGNPKDGRAGTGMYDAVVKLPASHSGRKALEGFLAKRSLKITDDVPVSVKEDFLRLVAGEYYRITTSAIRSAAPNHLVLGCRFAGIRYTPDIAWEEGGKWNDAMSVNFYPPADLSNGVIRTGVKWDTRPVPEKLKELHALCRKPIIITEWSFPALDTGRPCKFGAGQRMPTQKERTQASELFIRTMLAEPVVVGYIHFRWADQPVLGRWKMKGGEDCNYGLVNEQDEPYGLLTEMFTEVQAGMYGIRRASPANDS